MHRLVNPTQSYAWGSRTALAEFLGVPTPVQEPQAELWLGAHPSAPSRVLRGDREQSLVDLVAADPPGTLGPSLARRSDGRLPFLLKVLAVAGPLSLQVHPDRAAARQGYAAEQEAGVPADSPERMFRDDNHKPELIYALTPFDALCGLRPVVQILALLADLGVRQLRHPAEDLARHPSDGALRDLLEAILRAGDPGGLVESVLDAGRRRVELGSPFAPAYDGAVALAEEFPGDPGIVVSLLLNRLRLEPGQAVYLPPGRLHAYLSGLGIEVMACSDNVLRGGLTSKPVDVPGFLAAADFGPGQLTVVPARRHPDGWQLYTVPVDDFGFARADVAGGPIHSVDAGPQILLCVDGGLRLVDETGPIDLRRGQSVFAPAGARIEVTGSGSLVRATAG